MVMSTAVELTSTQYRYYILFDGADIYFWWGQLTLSLNMQVFGNAKSIYNIQDSTNYPIFE